MSVLSCQKCFMRSLRSLTPKVELCFWASLKLKTSLLKLINHEM